MASANLYNSQTSLWKPRKSLRGPIAILWDIENCPVPSNVHPEDVAGNIRLALQTHPIIDGAVTVFSAYGDFNAFPRRLREGCQRTGVKLVDVPNGRKDAADKAILVDMFLFALDNRPPSSIMLISGDVDFAPALHILGQRGYTVILVIPSRVGISPALSNAGRFLWDWPSMARGEGFVPQAKISSPCADISGLLRGCPIDETVGIPNSKEEEEEAILYRGMSRSNYSTNDSFMISEPATERNSGSISLPDNPTTSGLQTSSGVDEVSGTTSASDDQKKGTLVQQGDLNHLKGQLVKLLELLGGRLPLSQIHTHYLKTYGRPLCAAEYGATKLKGLLRKMTDTLTVEGEGVKKCICLSNSEFIPDVPSIGLSKGDNKGKEKPGENIDVIASSGSSDEFLGDEKVVVEEHLDDTRRGQNKVLDQCLDHFKYELTELLSSYSGKIFLNCFPSLYQQMYKRPLDYESYGVVDLDKLLTEVRDVAVLQEDPAGKIMYLVAASG